MVCIVGLIVEVTNIDLWICRPGNQNSMLLYYLIHITILDIAVDVCITAAAVIYIWYLVRTGAEPARGVVEPVKG